MKHSKTRIELPDDLAEALDRCAAARGVTRDQVIADALRRLLAPVRAWSPAFLRAIANPRPDLAEAADEMMAAIRAGRSRSPARRL